jgi:hypothetical protein
MSETTSERVQEELTQNILVDEKNSVIINPSENFVKSVIDKISDGANVGNIRMAANEDTVKSVMREFLPASKASELIESGDLTLRTSTEAINGSVIATGGDIRCIVDLNGTLVITEGQEYTRDIESTIESIWENSSEFNIRTPSLRKIYATMRDELGDEVAEDYQNIIEGMENSRTSDDGMDEVATALLVASKHNILLYDVSKWGEDCGLASKAKFSRTKTRLEDNGYIDTEKVPIDVGRPRLRLKLAPNVFEEDYDSQVISIVQSTI